MALTQTLMAFGAPPAMATAVVGDVQNSQTATGTNQATAFGLSAVTTVFTTTASGTGALLPPMNPGDDVMVVNLGANALLVYPRGTSTIQGGGAGAGFSVPAAKTAIFTARDGVGNCVVLLSA